MKRVMKLTLMVTLTLVLGYCAWGALFGPVMFDIVVLNTGKNSLDKVELEFERFEFRFGILPERWGSATYGMYIGPWPSKLTVSWIDDGDPGRIYIQELVVPGRLDTSWKESLEMVIEFKDSGPRVYARVQEEAGHGLRYRYE